MYSESKHRKQGGHSQQRSDYTSTAQDNIQSAFSSRPHWNFFKFLRFYPIPNDSREWWSSVKLRAGTETITSDAILFSDVWASSFEA